jgi:FkbM family methyltransferase
MTDDPALPQFGFNQLVMTRHGPMLANRQDIYVGASVIQLGEFSKPEADFLAQIVHPGHIVVEVGANIGTHTVRLAQRVAPGGFMLAFEPQRIVFQTLCANLALNSLANVIALPFAVGDAPGMINVPAIAPDQPANFGGIAVGGADGEPTALVTIDSYALPGCRLIKIDVEGMEATVLSGAVQTILRHKPFLYVENDRRPLSPPLIQLIGSLGYDMYWHLPPLDAPENFNGRAEPLFPGIVSVNMLCVPAAQPVVVEGLQKVAGPQDWPLPE